MVRLSLGVAAFCLLLASAATSSSQAAAKAPASKAPAAKVVAVQAPPPVTQPAAYIVVDAGSGMVLGQRDADKVWYPASVTKLMTAYLTFQALKTGQIKLTTPVIESANALAEPPSKMGYAVGTTMTVDN